MRGRLLNHHPAYGKGDRNAHWVFYFWRCGASYKGSELFGDIPRNVWHLKFNVVFNGWGIKLVLVELVLPSQHFAEGNEFDHQTNLECGRYSY